MAISKVDYDGRTLIDLTEDTVRANVLLTGYKAHAANGEEIVGTYSGGSGGKAQAKIITPSSSTMVIVPDEGYDFLTQVIVRSIPYKETLNEQGGLDINIGLPINYTNPIENGTGKAVTPSTTEIEVLPDEGEDYFSDLTVNAVPYNEYGGIITIGE